MKQNSFLLLPLLIVIFYGCSTSKSSVRQNVPPSFTAPREFRAAWVASVANIDWPSKRGLTTEQQKSEALALLNFLQQHNFNAVILQVRPAADALYESRLEPWSYYLTGQQGQAPSPYYDPLEFWIQEAHKRGIELHAWLNPYRSHHKSGGEVTEHSIVKKRPELSVFLKDGYWWFDPALKGTQEHSTAVVMDIIKRYDVDGIHFDDYFYPYRDYNKGDDFPDDVSWTAYQTGGGKLSRGDWRRDAVNSFIENLYKKIKAEKPLVKFGLSPFGIWRPGYPQSVSGFDQYEQLYADAKLWLNKGWIDYFTPQLYWPINRMGQSFPVLLGWWKGENTQNRHLWPGMSVGRDTSARNVNEVMSQIMITRGMLPESMGAVHWNISAVYKNANMAKALIEGPYKKPALVPASPWLSQKQPAAPDFTIMPNGEDYKIRWTHANKNEIFKVVVYQKGAAFQDYYIFNGNQNEFTVPVPASQRSLQIGLSVVNRNGNESAVKWKSSLN